MNLQMENQLALLFYVAYFTYLTFILFASSSKGSKCKLDTHRFAASKSSSSTSTLSYFNILTVDTFPYRQNKLNTRSQLIAGRTRSRPCTSKILLIRDRQHHDGSVRFRDGLESPLQALVNNPKTSRDDRPLKFL